MLQKWKYILTNWINCYFSESEKKEQCVTLESLLNIISHLRENLNLDESKSSILEAHTVEEFVQEKFPEFLADSASVQLSGEDETCYVASLLLFFVCVNSKDVDIKTAMCSKLSSADQETILKFSKRLMDCSPITLKDVQAAIAESCGQEPTVMEAGSSRVTVAETPPALRSLHGEVRRLQAALDAERFDRNYLQEELARTNLRVEMLAKDKEQYKLEIMNLKAKISMCCGQESDSRVGDVTGEGTARLMRQLEETEERLVQAQGQLDDAQYERDLYKTKINELKQERDKLLTERQQEAEVLRQTVEELDSERRHVESLRELVTELQQHHQMNRLDASQLECDDPDASIHSLHHNSSVCSEACANVIEVQLSEERAKIVVLKQHIQSLQDQLSELTQKTESEKQSFEMIISEKENDIFNLKHRINEEIEEKNNMTIQYSDDVSKLNNEINELEQKLKDNNNQCRLIVEIKMQEIQTLQEEKLSLLQSLTDETTKLETDIKKLNSELEVERNTRSKMKEDYENHIMKLNEKVLNRNNELVELQNNVCEMSEKIESLHLDLRKEKQAKEELIEKHHRELEQMNEKLMQNEDTIKRKCEEIDNLAERLNYNFDVIKEYETELENLKYSLSEQNENCNILEATKEKLLEEVSMRDHKIEELHKDIDNWRNNLNEERDKLTHDLDSAIATVNTLQVQLQDELQYKIGLQNENTTLKHSKSVLMNEVENIKIEINELKNEIKNKDETIEGMDLYLQEQKNIIEKLKTDSLNLNKKLQEISEEICLKNDELKQFEQKLFSERKAFEEDLQEKEQMIQSINKELSTEKDLISSLNLQLHNETEKTSQELNEKIKQISDLQEKCTRLNNIVEQNRKCFQIIESKLEEETLKCAHLEKSFDTHTTKLMHKLNITEKVIKELKVKYKKADEEKLLQTQVLKGEIKQLKHTVEKEREHAAHLQREKDTLTQKLAQEISYRKDFEKEYQNQITKFTDITSQLNAEILAKNKETNEKVQTLLEAIEEKRDEIKDLEEKLLSQMKNEEEVKAQKDLKINELKTQISSLKEFNDRLSQEIKDEVEQTKQTVLVLQKENEQLHFTIEEDNISHEVLKKEKDAVIENLEEKLRIMNVQLGSIQKDFEDSTLTFAKYKIEVQDNLKEKDTEISKLRLTVQELEENIKQNLIEAEKVKIQMSNQVQEFKDKYLKAKSQRHEDMMSFINELSAEETKINDLASNLNSVKDELIDEKNMRIKFQTESHELQNEIRSLNQELAETKTAVSKLIENNQALLDEKAILTQQLIEEKSTRTIIEEQKDLLMGEKTSLKEKFDVEGKIKNGLLEDKERLTQQLVEEKSAKELAEKEKENLATEIVELTKAKENVIQELYTVMQEDMALRQQLKQVEIEKQKIKNDSEMLANTLGEEKCVKDDLVKEKDSLTNNIETLKRELAELKASNDILTSNINRMTVEKESLLNSLRETEVACQELEKEKDALVQSVADLKILNEQHIQETKEKQEEFDVVKADLADMKTKKDKYEEANAQITSILMKGVEKLINNLKKEDTTNEVLKRLISIENSEALSMKEKCDLVVNIADTLTTELSLRKNLEVALEHENTALTELRQMLSQKEMQVLELQTEVNRLQQTVNEYKIEMSKQKESYATSLDTSARNIQTLQQDNQSLINELNDVKVQLEVKVHSLKEKLTDNENLTEKLKKTYESQIDNLNIMVNKLTNYLKDKTVELEALRKDKERLQEVVDDSNKVIRSLEDEVKTHKQSQEKLISDFESERLVLKNMVTVTESVMEDQKMSLNNIISEHVKANEMLKEENKELKELMKSDENTFEKKIKEKESLFENVFKELAELRLVKENNEKDFEMEKQSLASEIEGLRKDLSTKVSQVEILELQNKELAKSVQDCKNEISTLEGNNNEIKIKLDELQIEITKKVDKISKELSEQVEINQKLNVELQQQIEMNKNIEIKIQELHKEIDARNVVCENVKREKSEYEIKVAELQTKLESKTLEMDKEIQNLQEDKMNLTNIIEENKIVIIKLENLVKQEAEQNKQILANNDEDKINLNNKCSILQEYQTKAEKHLDGQKKDIIELQSEVEVFKSKVEACEKEMKEKDEVIKQKDELINAINEKLLQVKREKERYEASLETRHAEVNELRQKMDRNNDEVMKALRSEEWVKAIGQRETFAVAVTEKTGSHKNSCPLERDGRDFLHQVDNTTSDLTHSSMESIKTISDLEKIIHDKNRTITTLQSDITYLKSLIADSENKLLDVTKELEISKENCHQLSGQLKKIVHQKNEEIAELKKQVNKMTVTENRASQIIKVSAKYQAIILKRIAEIKSNTVLKELTNFGNTANGDNELRRSLNAGTITMEDLENFLETTDKHLKRCSEKQIALQKERDRLTEVNRINESEIINLKKFLTELSVSFKTFSTVKDLYAQRLSRVVSMQRTVRREILNLDGHITDGTMCKLERGYAAVMQDLSECVMNMERWVERCIGRAVAPEKIKQAFSGDDDRASLASASFQNTSLEVQLEELENSFQKLLEEVVRAPKGEGAKDAQAVTVMEVRAEYEDKLNRMKAKMKQLYQEQIAVYKDKQKEEIALLERELAKTREKMAESSKAYEEHIRALTAELWSVGEKFLTKKDEVDWLRKKQRSGSLMSLQHVHSSGLVPPQEEPSRPSDTHSLRSLPVNNNANANTNNKCEGRGLHMSDEEGEVFDNRWLKELSATPGRPSAAASTPRGGVVRLSELRWRNSLCPPHLKSSYPAETQFAPAFDEEDIKFSLGGASSIGGRNQRKEVGITAYKKPGPPTPSKQAGRLSATDSELRESLRVEAEPQPSRKTSTPSRLRSLFRSSKNDTAEGTPRSRRLSIFRKK